MYKIYLFIGILSLSLLLSGCVGTGKLKQKDIDHRESILLKAKNHDGLVALYREKLKQHENPETRLKLAQYYYLDNDSKSSLYYL